MKIWTVAYRPFVMGGNVYATIYCEVEVTGPHDLGKGYQGYMATSPSGETFVVESTTGAIVGPTLEEVRADVAAADKTVMDEQIANAAEQFKEAERVSPDYFWRFLRAHKAAPTEAHP